MLLCEGWESAMPDRVRIIAGPRNIDFDDYIRDLVEERGYGKEREYVGCTTRERAEEIRRRLRMAGKHLGVSVKAFWAECGGCKPGGDSCAYHVRYTAYHPDVARAYKSRQTRR